uniref:Uncharacterized protein n=1 Tax=Romanomermis culicivorax TaxID=13658 RepID=A0A915JLY7_ROMCU
MIRLPIYPGAEANFDTKFEIQDVDLFLSEKIVVTYGLYHSKSRVL